MRSPLFYASATILPLLIGACTAPTSDTQEGTNSTSSDLTTGGQIGGPGAGLIPVGAAQIQSGLPGSLSSVFVEMLYYGEWGSDIQASFECTGVLISPTVVLTSPLCASRSANYSESLDPVNAIVWFAGQTKTSSVQVAAGKIHFDIGLGTDVKKATLNDGTHGIGLLILPSALPNTVPIALSAAAPVLNEHLALAGYTLPYYGGSPPIAFTLVGGTDTWIAPTYIGISGIEQCAGDTGGPVMQQLPGKAPTLTGLSWPGASAKNGTCVSTNGQGATRIDAFLPLIKKYAPGATFL
jgi:hypothetical protein